MPIVKIKVRRKRGLGSGNWGHSGRPGLVGGSKGGPGSGNRDHAGIPGHQGGSMPSGITSDHVKKLKFSMSKVARGDPGFSSGYIGRQKTEDLEKEGYIEKVTASYYKLTSKGNDLIAGKAQVQEVTRERTAPKEFDPSTVEGHTMLSRKNAEAYMKTLPGYPKDRNVHVEAMTDTRSHTVKGARAAARYFEGSIELPSSSRAKTVAHELGHYLYDFSVRDRQAIFGEYNKARAKGGSELFRDYAFKNAHEFFSDSYSMYVFGSDSDRRRLAADFPDTWKELTSLK